MRTNPLRDTFLFLLGRTPDHAGSGAGPLLVILFSVLLLASALIFNRTWDSVPSQRTLEHVATWFMRFMIGCMWFQGSLWKLPLPVSSGLRYWTEEEGHYAAFEFYKTFVKSVLVPALPVLDSVVYFTELSLGVAFMLGFAVRPMAIIGILFTLQLWIGLYQHPTEWPWSYIFLIFTMGFFYVTRAGLSFGLDGLLARNPSGLFKGQGRIATVYRRLV